MNYKSKSRLIYIIAFLIVLILEILIALFVRDSFIRPYVGDILVTVLICCFVRSLFPHSGTLVLLGVFIFSFAVEIGQYFDIVSLIGLGHVRFFRILIGTTFSVADIVCYAAGCVAFWLTEKIILQKIKALE